MIQTYTFTGTGRQIDAQGVFFRYESGTDGSGVTAIRVLADGAILGTFEPGDTIDLPTPAKRWEIYPTSTGCIGAVRVGNARVSSNKLQGIVQTVDGGRARSISGVAFSGYVDQQGVASNSGFVQLFNATGSNKLLIVNRLSILCGASPSSVIASFGATPFTSQLQMGQSKRVYGSMSTAGQLRYQSQATPPSSSGSLRGWQLQASTTFDYVPSEPIVLSSGASLNIGMSAQNNFIGATFEWFEEAA